MLIFWLLLAIFIFAALWIAFWSLVTFLVQNSDYQKKFLQGSTPAQPPDGFYQGTAHVLFDKQTPWLGKSFNSADNLGFNVFTSSGGKLLRLLTPLYNRFSRNSEGNTKAFYFKTRSEPALKDAPLNVIKLDYDSAENPFIIRIILDEIVEIAPEQYLGKIHLKVLPGFYSTIGYFGLKKLFSPGAQASLPATARKRRNNVA